MGVSLCLACRLIMLSTLSPSLRSASAVLARTVSTSHVVSQQTMVAHTQEGEEMVAHRPAATQMNNMMDIGSRRIFTPEQDMFRESARKFMREVLAPQQAKFEEMGEPTREAWLAMGEQGLLGISTPAEVGGVGGTFIDEMIACWRSCCCSWWRCCSCS